MSLRCLYARLVANVLGGYVIVTLRSGHSSADSFGFRLDIVVLVRLKVCWLSLPCSIWVYAQCLYAESGWDFASVLCAGVF